MVKRTLAQKLWNQRILVAMALPFMVWMLVFNFAPLMGWSMAFVNYKPRYGIFSSEWVGLKYFAEFITDNRFYEVLRNTFAMSGLNIFFGTFSAIGLAVLLSEVRSTAFKRTIQTVSYLPHFISWVVVSNIFYTFLSSEGLFNDVLLRLGITSETVSYMSKETSFWGIVTFSQVWKEMGWNAILYLAAITAIDPQLYEAATLDGVTRFGKIRYITIPCIMPTIMMLLVLNIGNLLNATGFDPSYLMGNDMTVNYSENLAVYAYTYGMQMSRYSMSTALSIFNSMFSLLLVWSANKLSTRFIEGGIL
ncbi:MAG: ABC transporter permease subunit [Eubacteriales bacterium]|nr:ABC transporter permease subunit [Eubacteriales bacterium]